MKITGEGIFWFFLFFGGAIFAFLDSASPLIIGIIAVSIVALFLGTQFLEVLKSSRDLQRKRLEVEQERLKLEASKANAILNLDEVEVAEKIRKLGDL